MCDLELFSEIQSHLLPNMVNRNLWNQARNLGISLRFQKIPKNFVCAEPLGLYTSAHLL